MAHNIQQYHRSKSSGYSGKLNCIPFILHTACPILLYTITADSQGFSLKMPDMDDGMPDVDDLWHPQVSPEESGLTWGRLMN